MTFARRDVSDPHEFDGRPPPHWIHNCPRCSHLVSRDEDASSHWRDIVARCTDPSHGTLSARLMNPCFLGISAITILLLTVSALQLLSHKSPPLPRESPTVPDSERSDGLASAWAWLSPDQETEAPSVEPGGWWWPWALPDEHRGAAQVEGWGSPFSLESIGLSSRSQEEKSEGNTWWMIGGAKHEISSNTESAGNSGPDQWGVLSTLFEKAAAADEEGELGGNGMLSGLWSSGGSSQSEHDTSGNVVGSEDEGGLVATDIEEQGFSWWFETEDESQPSVGENSVNSGPVWTKFSEVRGDLTGKSLQFYEGIRSWLDGLAASLGDACGALWAHLAEIMCSAVEYIRGANVEMAVAEVWVWFGTALEGLYRALGRYYDRWRPAVVETLLSIRDHLENLARESIGRVREELVLARAKIADFDTTTVGWSAVTSLLLYVLVWRHSRGGDERSKKATGESKRPLANEEAPVSQSRADRNEVSMGTRDSDSTRVGSVGLASMFAESSLGLRSSIVERTAPGGDADAGRNDVKEERSDAVFVEQKRENDLERGSSPSKKALHSGPSEGAPVNHGKKERRSSGMVVVERRGSVKSGYAERHRRSSAAQLLELYNGRNRRVSRLEQLGVMSATRAVEASGTEFGMEFGDNVDDRNKKNPFTPRRNGGAKGASSQEFRSPRSVHSDDRRPHPPGVRRNSAEIIHALRAKRT